MPRDNESRPSTRPDHPRKFLRVATQRFAEAEFLLGGGYIAASIYLSGYSVECGLKALILSTESKEGGRVDLANSFRGSGWHNFIRLFEFYSEERKGPAAPAKVARELTYVTSVWSVDLRYQAGERPYREARRFLDSTSIVLEWIKGRL